MSHTPPEPPLGEVDAALLAALHRAYGGDTFDEHSVSAHVQYQHPQLRAPLAAALGLERLTLGRSGFLPLKAVDAVGRWLARAEGRPLRGFVLRKDRIGWSRVEPIGPALLPGSGRPSIAAGPTGPAG